MVLGKVVSSENAAFRLADSVFKSINQKNAHWRNCLWFDKGYNETWSSPDNKF